jgi:hypothetical protein
VAITKSFPAGASTETSAGGPTLTSSAFSSSGFTHVVAFTKHETHSASATVSDNKGSGNFTKLTQQQAATSNAWGQLHWAKIGTPGTSHTVTMTTNAAADFRTLIVWLINSGTGDIQVVSSPTASGTSATPSAGTVSNAGALSIVSIMGVAETAAVTWTPGSGWTEDWDQGSSVNSTYGGSRGAETTTSFAANATATGSMDWAACAAAFAELTATDLPPQESCDCYSDDAGWCDESALIEATTPSQSVDFVPLTVQMGDDAASMSLWADGFEDPFSEILATVQEMQQPPPAVDNGPEDAWPADAVDEDLDSWREHMDFVLVGADAVILPGLVPGDEWPWHTEQAGHDDDYPPLVDDADDAVGPDAPATLDQPPEDGFPRHFDEADLDELFVDDYANEEVEALRAVEWTWADDGLDEWALESAPVGADAGAAPEQPQPAAGAERRRLAVGRP